ncbi:MAG: hypothetical protein JWR19_1702 [Pedosphaera sp.]|nr:hypothetical protein [Pedosphaera sp.]
MKLKNHEVFTLVLIITGASRLFACGPTFPNNLLNGGDASVLAAPVVNFSGELEQMKLGPPKFTANITTNSYTVDTMEADVSDLHAALKKAGVETREKERILKAYRAEREKLRLNAETMARWRRDEWSWEDGSYKKKDKGSAPNLEEITIVPGLPEEFADYFRGSIAYHRGETNDARIIWQALLDRPKSERHFRSTWAAFMLGQLCGPEESESAISYFAQVRTLAREGFADTLGLAAASFGQEARVDLKQNKFEPAIEFYLQQYSAGDPSAIGSLGFAARDALREGTGELPNLAKNPRTQRLITAYIISRGKERPVLGEHAQDVIKTWLDAVETAEVRDVESAEQLALAAYQNGDMDLAQRWIDRAPSTPTAQWLQAKLLLRDGKLDRAASLLAHVVRLFPLEPRSTNEVAETSLKDNLYMPFSDYYPDTGLVANQILGELGVLHLARREYQESLDALLRSGHWMDAAYVAERVLTVDELKTYVNRNWPAMDDREAPAPKLESADAELSYNQETNTAKQEIRYLLARRLTRLCRGGEAREYYPKELQPRYAFLILALNTGRDETLPAETRATALFKAATITRHEGMELLGTELAPDYAVHGGSFDYGVDVDCRTNNPNGSVLSATPDELHRYTQNHADPEARYHYRYQAAFIALEAAKLMPNNSDATARVLCTAGSWLKRRDPETADLFYKALVRRCRNTAIGAEADRKRWFPELDEQGNLLPPVLKKQPEAASPPEVAEPMQENLDEPMTNPVIEISQ